MEPDQKSAYETNRQKMERGNLSHFMVESAENDSVAEVDNTSEDVGSQTSDPKSLKAMVPPDGVVNKPLMECYPEIADDEHEQLLADVRRHWLGRFFIVFSGIFLAVFMLVFAALLPHFVKSLGFSLSSSTTGVLAVVFIFVAALIVGGMLISLWVYNQSRMLITDQNVIEVRQNSIFSRKVSHLNMINVEDVTVIKKGILPTFFDFGTLTTETAGEEENFVFTNTPTPDKYRRLIINAHEEAIERLGRLGSAQRIEIAKK